MSNNTSTPQPPPHRIDRGNGHTETVNPNFPPSGPRKSEPSKNYNPKSPFQYRKSK